MFQQQDMTEQKPLGRYKVSASHRGACLILKNNSPEWDNEQFDRDISKLRELFKEEFNFRVLVKTNLETSQIQTLFDNLNKAKDDCGEFLLKADTECFVCCILYGRDGNKTDPFTRSFLMNCTEKYCELKGKPKLFFVQTIRSRKTTKTVAYTDDLTDNVVVPFGDIFIAKSTLEVEDSSLDQISNGSYFIQKLCEVFEQNARFTKLQDMMLMINQEMQKKNAPVDGKTVVQVADTTMNTLCRHFYFYPKTLKMDESKGSSTAAKRPRYEGTSEVLGRYRMSNNSKGTCLIINNTFENTQHRRHGTENDKERLKTLFEWLHFDVTEQKDLSATKLKELFGNLENEINLSDTDCFVCCILSHGNNSVILGNDKKPVEKSYLKECVSPEKCPKLKGKPKLFFIQACRGELHLVSTDTPNFTMEDKTKERDNFEGDIYIAESTVEKHNAYRGKKGSPFIQTVFTVFKENAHNRHLNNLMLMVNRDLREVEDNNIKIRDNKGEWIDVKAVSDISMNTFSRHLYFHPDKTFEEYEANKKAQEKTHSEKYEEHFQNYKNFQCWCHDMTDEQIKDMDEFKLKENLQILNRDESKSVERNDKEKEFTFEKSFFKESMNIPKNGDTIIATLHKWCKNTTTKPRMLVIRNINFDDQFEILQSEKSFSVRNTDSNVSKYFVYNFNENTILLMVKRTGQNIVEAQNICVSDVKSLVAIYQDILENTGVRILGVVITDETTKDDCNFCKELFLIPTKTVSNLELFQEWYQKVQEKLSKDWDLLSYLYNKKKLEKKYETFCQRMLHCVNYQQS